jgi:hypothetical protein
MQGALRLNSRSAPLAVCATGKCSTYSCFPSSEGISPALRRGPLSFSHGIPSPNDGTQDVDEEEEEQADLDKEDDAPEPMPTSKGRKKMKNSPSTESRIKWTGKEEECLAEA